MLCLGCALSFPWQGWFAVCGQRLWTELPDPHPVPDPHPSPSGFSHVKCSRLPRAGGAVGSAARGEWSWLAASGSAWQVSACCPCPRVPPPVPLQLHQGPGSVPGLWLGCCTIIRLLEGQTNVPSPCQSPVGERCHITNSALGLCRDALWKLRARMRPGQEWDSEPCCHHFHWSLAPACL